MGTPLRHQNLKKLKTLFLSTLYISAFTFGGGFVIVGFMRRKFVHDLHWIDEEEMLDFAALAQSCPGAVAVNAAILIGWKICGFAGMLTAVLGTILPPMIITSVISLFYSAFASQPSDIRCPSRHGSRSYRHSSGCCLRPWHGNC